MVRQKIFEEIRRRESGYLLPKSKEMPLRYCQIKANQGYDPFENSNKPVFGDNTDDLLISAQ